jgi:hypothetical protein
MVDGASDFTVYKSRVNNTADEYTALLTDFCTAFIESAPAHFETAFCVVEQAPRHAQGRLRYHIGSKDHPHDQTNQPSPELHDAACALVRHFLGTGDGFPGIEAEAVLEDGSWRYAARMIDPKARLRDDEEQDALWQDVYAARKRAFVETFGQLPENIHRSVSLTAVWPGGGLLQIPASKIAGRCVTTTFGLTNLDMPTRIRVDESRQTAVSFSASLAARTPRWIAPELAGYGYELLVLTPAVESWPLRVLGWLAETELLHDLHLLDRVRKNGGFTIEDVELGHGRHADFLIAPALPPLPPYVELPNGTMEVLVATRITRDEMELALVKGQSPLHEILADAGVAQVSRLDRASIL